MKILFLAPQPFYQERGTPIAVNLAVRTLCDFGHTVDLLVYHEGEYISHPGLTLHRIARVPFVRNVRPGLSLKKLACDTFMFFKTLSLLRRTKPDIVHAVEESVFIAWFVRLVFRTPYIYDMDSSMPDQIVEKYPFAAPLRPLFRSILFLAVRSALMIAPVCDALMETLGEKHAARSIVLRDVSLISDDDH